MIEDIINNTNETVVINVGKVLPDINYDNLHGTVHTNSFFKIKEFLNPDKQDIYIFITCDVFGNKYITCETSFVFNKIDNMNQYKNIDYLLLLRKEKLKKLCNK